MESAVRESLVDLTAYNWIQRNDPIQLWNQNRQLFITEAVFLAIGFTTFLHATLSQHRVLLLTWLAIVVHAIQTELVSVPIVPDRWFAESMIVLFDRRVPLYFILGVVPTIFYSPIAIAHSYFRGIRVSSMIIAVVQMTLLLRAVEAVGTKFVLWHWDHHVSVSEELLNNIAGGFTSFPLHFFVLAMLIGGLDRKVRNLNNSINFALAILVGLATFWISLPFSLISAAVKQEFSVDLAIFKYAVIFASIFLTFHCFDNQQRNRKNFTTLFVCNFIPTSFLAAMALFGRPQDILVQGNFQPVGPCNSLHSVETVFGRFSKPKFLCVSELKTTNVDWFCSQPSNSLFSSSSYVVCGTEIDGTELILPTALAFLPCIVLLFLSILRRNAHTETTKTTTVCETEARTEIPSTPTAELLSYISARIPHTPASATLCRNGESDLRVRSVLNSTLLRDGNEVRKDEDGDRDRQRVEAKALVAEKRKQTAAALARMTTRSSSVSSSTANSESEERQQKKEKDGIGNLEIQRKIEKEPKLPNESETRSRSQRSESEHDDGTSSVATVDSDGENRAKTPGKGENSRRKTKPITKMFTPSFSGISMSQRVTRSRRIRMESEEQEGGGEGRVPEATPTPARNGRILRERNGNGNENANGIGETTPMAAGRRNGPKWKIGKGKEEDFTATVVDENDENEEEEKVPIRRSVRQSAKAAATRITQTVIGERRLRSASVSSVTTDDEDANDDDSEEREEAEHFQHHQNDVTLNELLSQKLPIAKKHRFSTESFWDN